MLEAHKIHASLLRPPTFLGMERELFFTAAAAGIPILFYGNLSFRSLALLSVYSLIAGIVGRRLTAADHNLVRIFVNSLAYRDHYDPLPSPCVPSRKLSRRGLW